MAKTSGVISQGIRRKPTVALVVGLDFGTSSTKVAYRELGSATRQIRPLLFNHGLRDYPEFCLPSVGFLDARGRFVWGSQAAELLTREPWYQGIRRLKVLVAGEVEPEFRDDSSLRAFQAYTQAQATSPELLRPRNLAAVALCQQMHIVRRLLAQIYPHAVLDLRFNICVPIDHLQNGLMLRHYYKVLDVAELLYNEWIGDGWAEPELLELADANFEGASETEHPGRRLFPVPEAMAEVASYLMSLETQEGLHAVLDIGAGTTDLSIFHLMGPDKGDRGCYWYSARNYPRGAGYVEARVAEVLSASDPGKVVTQAAILEALRSPSSPHPIRSGIREELERIHHLLRPTWVEAYNHFRQTGMWDGIPLFMAGGGAELPSARDVFLKPYIPNFRDLDVRPLPVPDDYQASISGAPFSRLSVAYGLTFLLPELGDYRLPADCPDHTPQARYISMPEQLGDGSPG